MSAGLPLSEPLAAIIVAAMSLSACAGGDGDLYPSLAIRDAERVTGELTPAAPAPDPVEPIVSAETLSQIVTRARELDRRFEAARGETLALARRAKGAGPESDLRSRALVAIADLNSLHSRTALTLADLDQLEAEAAIALAPIEPIREAQAQVAGLVAGQDEALDQVEAAAR